MTKKTTADSDKPGYPPEDREALLRLSVEALKQLGRASAAEPEAARAILELIRARTGIEAAAIRLRDGEDFPYHAASGFPEDFLLAENFLRARGAAVGLERDPGWKAPPDCLCGSVLRGEGLPESPCYTEGGSFYTGDAAKLRELPGRPDGIRHRCNLAGYSSVALLPLKTDDGIIGLLQLNDRRPDRYSPGLIRFFEEFSCALGAGISRELAAKKLEQFRKAEAVRRLAGGMAHNFNNILGAVRGYAEFLRGDLPRDAAVRGDVEEILTATDRAAALAHQLLAVSQRQPLSPAVLDLNQMAGELAAMLVRIGGDGLKVDIRPEPVPCLVKADATQLKLAITSLAAGALDAGTGDGPVILETRLLSPGHEFLPGRRDPPGGLLVCLSISVGGVLSGEVQSRLFEPYYTIREQERTAELGLAAALGIVRQSGGEIEVESKPGRGTTFRLYLPFTEEVPEKAEAGEPGAPAPGGKTVLVVDDDAALLKVAVRILRKGGYSVLSAPGGREALGLLAEHGGPVDLLVTDLVMSGMSGPELALEVSRGNPAARILFISGKPDEEVSEPARAFICKPFTHEELLLKVRSVLDGPAGAAKK